MIEWKHLFRSHILERGWDYYQSGCVRNVKPIGRGFTAIVDGSHEYDVSIILEDGHVIDMFCDCPYAEDGSHCKHMAAVLYRISEEDFEEFCCDCDTCICNAICKTVDDCKALFEDYKNQVITIDEIKEKVEEEIDINIWR